jgi:malate synthase
MVKYVRVAGIQVHPTLYNTVAKEIAPGTGVSADAFWAATSRLIKDFGPRNEALLRKRDSIQAQIDAWHLNNTGKPHDPIAYTAFLAQIGYLVPEGPVSPLAVHFFVCMTAVLGV